MIVDRTALSVFPPQSLTVSSLPWRALSIFFGSSGWTQNSASLISTVTKLLAAQNINIFYTSTSQTDFILVHEKNLRKAITALKDTFQVIDADLSEEEKGFSGELTDGIFPQHILASSSEPILFVFRPNLEVTMHEQMLSICSIHKESRSAATRALLKTIFFESSFFSFTETEDEISILLEQRLLDQFPQDLLTASEIYRPLERFAKADLNEVGVISALSAPLSAAKIPMLYLSTFNSAFIMVLETDVQQAKIWLENAGYKFVLWKDSAKSRVAKPSTPFKFSIHTLGKASPTPLISRDTPKDNSSPSSSESGVDFAKAGRSLQLPSARMNRSGSIDGDSFTQFNLDLDDDK
jgi:hypothetical protein